MDRHNAEEQLKRIFRLRQFHDPQWETISRLFKGERVLLIQRTGFGKSLCFQFPATIFKGTTVIFSPLIALMRDQVRKLNELNIPARCINSEQPDDENKNIMDEAKNGMLKILYIAPERQENQEWLEAVRSINLSMVVIDEAHCVSLWGHDFRPAFRRIINLVNLLPSRFPVLATTATATRRVEEDIVRQMGGNIKTIRGRLLRDNFYLMLVHAGSEDEKFAWLGENMSKIPGNGIIYTGTRVNTEIYSRWLESIGVNCIGYNAGLDGIARKDIEKGFMENRWKCVVSTNALGMGIDKPDIRFIIHTQMTASPIHYYQEIGRAGRDGEKTYIVLMYNPEDVELPQMFIDTARPPISAYNKVAGELLKEPLGEIDIMLKTNLRREQVRVIKEDLIDQRIIHEVQYGKARKYEYRFNAPRINMNAFEELRNQKLRELDKMIEYAETNKCRMKYLCDFLGDPLANDCKKCDNCRNNKRVAAITDGWTDKIREFKGNCFPELATETISINLANGVAASYYGFSNVGGILHKCKYECGGDFPDLLLDLTIKAFNYKYFWLRFDMMLYVPPTESGDLVKNFARKLADMLKVDLSHDLVKLKETQPQKIFQNSMLKKMNIKDAFDYRKPDDVKGKNILLFDDIFDSGWTIKEIAGMLSRYGAKSISPIVIAKTIGGDLI